MKGLLFSAEMARANVAGRKTETRRLAGLADFNLQPDSWACRSNPDDDEGVLWNFRKTGPHATAGPTRTVRSRPVPGEVFYQKEAWQWNEPPSGPLFKADDLAGHIEGPWKSPLFLKARDARFFARIVEVRCERLQELTEEGAKAEGIEPMEKHSLSARDLYLLGWDRINPGSPASLNPWVWAYRYQAISREEAFNGAR